MSIARMLALSALFAAFLAAILSADEPAVQLAGLALLTWIALEGCWRLLDPRR
jgi:hypothetical protein